MCNEITYEDIMMALAHLGEDRLEVSWSRLEEFSAEDRQKVRNILSGQRGGEPCA